ncbi:putative holin-like toxin [Paenibacillus apiarius]|uniref:Holin-like toxin n=2 Tax=Paenibacillus TaxID=44249 RepID=A0ABT4DSB8_9BACL|nr:putative holin-like toxin [Paenibacillus profundus]MCY9514130.1 putative holin-like toxin [Paenibacillus apiarius]MCY9520253.1 putative holin-like toxin [Paenibacillus apiarius]MCY9550405.1 putative holin-like toxin [Paenibacillus apiarius]MCY9557467.1 putative holin-like toxin [Paenibacillus apiarius]
MIAFGLLVIALLSFHNKK